MSETTPFEGTLKRILSIEIVCGHKNRIIAEKLIGLDYSSVEHTRQGYTKILFEPKSNFSSGLIGSKKTPCGLEILVKGIISESAIGNKIIVSYSGQKIMDVNNMKTGFVYQK